MSGSVHCSFVALILVRYVLVRDTSYFYIYSIRPKRKSTVPCYHLIKHNIKPKKSHTTSQKDKKLTANSKFWSLITHRKNINCISIIKFSDLFFFFYLQVVSGYTISFMFTACYTKWFCLKQRANWSRITIRKRPAKIDVYQS